MTNCNNCAIEQEIARLATIIERIDHQLFGNGQPGVLSKQQDQLDGLDNWRSRMNGGMKALAAASTATILVIGLVFQALSQVKSAAAENKAEITHAEHAQQSDAFDSREAIQDANRRQKADAADTRAAINENAADSRARSKRVEAQQHSDATANREAFQKQGSGLRDVQAAVAKKN